MKPLVQWLEAQTGLPTRVRGFLAHRLAGGPRWRHSLYAALLFAFALQVITGFCLWTAYSPSSQTAWESVHHLQYETAGGWLLRGLHHAAAQLVMVLLAACIALAILTRAFRSSHTAGYWLLLTAVPIAVGMSVTGWLLPFDQNGYWAARVPLNILSIIPFIGPSLQTLLIGGPDVGHHTLTRFLALHAGLLPLCLAIVIYSAVRLVRRAAPGDVPAQCDRPWWPEQAWRDALLCAGVLSVALIMAWKGHDHPGAPLRAPADLSESYAAARPEWFFLFLFQFLKLFPGGTEIIGAIVIPGLAMALLAAMPFIERRHRGHMLNVTCLAVVAAGIVGLTFLAMRQDSRDPAHIAAVQQASRDAERARELIGLRGIPPAGAASLLRDDPATQGPRLFARQCASCHRFDGHDGLGAKPADPQSAPDLKGFASREWLAKVLDPATFTGPHFFGNTRHKDGKMAKFLNRDVTAYDATLKANLVKVIAAVSAEAALPSQRNLEEKETALIEEGRKLAATSEMRCAECHQFRKKDEDATAPDLTGYGSREWLVGIISDPSHDRFYARRNDRMPAFGRDQVLDERSIGLLADWLRGDVPRK